MEMSTVPGSNIERVPRTWLRTMEIPDTRNLLSDEATLDLTIGYWPLPSLFQNKKKLRE